MIIDDPYLRVRAASVYVAVMTTLALWLAQRPDARTRAGALLAPLWNLPILLAINAIAPRVGWWTYVADGGLLLGMPIDLLLAWACLWGTTAALAFPRAPVWQIVLLALTINLVAMPLGAPLIRLGPSWLIGEVVALVTGLVPALALARWTTNRTHLRGRALLQIVAFTGLLMFVLPAVAIHGSGGHWTNPSDRPVWQLSLLLQALAVPALFGLSAVHEFVTRGGGTPVPFDPPQKLVTSGLYAYVRNPMQVSALLLLGVLGLALGNLWISAAGVMAHLYSIGIASWDEEQDLIARFGDRWLRYRSNVSSWVPRLRPWIDADMPPATLWIADECGLCQQVKRELATRGVSGLSMLPAEDHPSQSLTRITYEHADGADYGVVAIGRALEHIHLGWALAGCVMRLPVVSPLLQLLVDASGGGPRLAIRHLACPAPPTVERRHSQRPSSATDARREAPARPLPAGRN